MAKQKKEAEAKVEEQEVGLLDQILTEGKLARDEYQAEAAKGTLLCIDRDQLPPPEEDEFYYSDLIGLEARLENGELFGKVINVDDFGAGDLIEIMPQNSQTSMYLSFTTETVPHIAISEGHITIVLPSYDEVSETKDEAARPAEE